VGGAAAAGGIFGWWTALEGRTLVIGVDGTRERFPLTAGDSGVPLCRGPTISQVGCRGASVSRLHWVYSAFGSGSGGSVAYC